MNAPLGRGPWGSLRGRYLVVMGLLALLFVGVTLAVYWTVGDAGRAAADNIQVRNQMLRHNRLLKDALRQGQDALAAYLRIPEPRHARAWTEAIAQARAQVEQLRGLASEGRGGFAASLETLERMLVPLDGKVREVIAVRADTMRLFPAMPVLSREMLPLHRTFEGHLDMATADLTAGGGIEDLEVFQHVDAMRHLWLKMIAAFRMYLTDRAGLFGPANQALEAQHANIATYSEAIHGHLDALEALAGEGRVGFELVAALPELEATARRWNQAYAEIRELSQSRHWRADIPAMEDVIQPAFEQVWVVVQGLDEQAEQWAREDIDILARTATAVSRGLWLFALAGVTLMGLGYGVMKAWVLRPIERVAGALEAEANGDGDSRGLLPATTLAETRSLVSAFSTMRRQVHDRQMALEHQALHDALTGLSNRVRLQDRLELALAQARRHSHPVVLMIMDLDRFKEINDTLGHQIGDELLRQLGRRLQSALRAEDTVARLGGDEFAVLLPEAGPGEARQVAMKLQETIERPFSVHAHQLYVGASIGIAVFPDHGADATTLTRHADVAMYVAKRAGAGHGFYDDRRDEHSVERLSLVNDLRAALAEDELHLEFQPKLCLTTNRVVGAEALLRWQHPAYGRVSPDQIVPIAERTGLIQPLLVWVLDAALQSCAQWHDQGIELGVAVNLSARNLQSPDLTREIAAALARHRLPPAFLTLELTESAAMDEPERALALFERISDMGVKLSVDDFGTGFSSLAYLKQFPVDELKVDRSFVIDMLRDEGDATLVHSIIDLGRNLGLNVVAEGVEDAATLERLRDLGCAQAQGYHIARPMECERLRAWLRAHPGGPADASRGEPTATPGAQTSRTTTQG